MILYIKINYIHIYIKNEMNFLFDKNLRFYF